MSDDAGAAHSDAPPANASRALIVSALGVTQILAWGSSYYLPAVLARPIAADTGWPLPWVVGGLSLGLLVAGLSSPFVGRAIQAAGGRRVLALSSALLGLGLAGLAVSESLPVYLGAWIVIGLGMGAGLYDAAFATLGRMYLKSARRTIAALTLFGGLASTVCWPLSAFLLEHLGWRGACLVYAGIQLFFALPLHLIVLPRRSSLPAIRADAGEPDKPSTRLIPSDQRLRFLVVASVIALASAISALVSVHLLTFLQNGGMTLAAAVALGALVGPAQVSARAIEMAFGRLLSPALDDARGDRSCDRRGRAALHRLSDSLDRADPLRGRHRYRIDCARHGAARDLRSPLLCADHGTGRDAKPDRAGASALARGDTDRIWRLASGARRSRHGGGGKCRAGNGPHRHEPEIGDGGGVSRGRGSGGFCCQVPPNPA